MDEKSKLKKEITFDLKQDALKRHYPKPEGSTNPEFYKAAYKDIQDFMLRNGFEHRQYSVYVSKGKLSSKDITNLARKMQRELPWLSDCVNKMDVTSVGRQHNLNRVLSKEKEYQEKLQLKLSKVRVEEKKFRPSETVEKDISKAKETKKVNIKSKDFDEEI